jgi:outer membrane protein assembly factor BamB
MGILILRLLVLIAAVGCAPVASAPPAATPAAATKTPAQPTSGGTSWPLSRGDELATGVAKSGLPAKPQVLWKYSTGKNSVEATPAVVDGVVYIGDMQEKLYALKLDTPETGGHKLWDFPGELGFPGSPAVRDGKVYCGDGEGIFYCLQASDAKVIWKQATEAEIVAGANFWKDKVLVGSQDSRLYCFDAKTGEIAWKLQIENQIRTFSTIVDDKCFVMQCDGKLHVVDLNKGEIVSSVPVEQANTTSTPAVLGDHLYFGTEDGAVMCINWKTPEIAWSIEEKSGDAFRSSPAVAEGIVVIGTRGRRVNALDPKDGSELWSFPTKNKVDASPVIVGDRVLVGAADGRIYLIDRKTGKETWQYQCQGGINAGAAVADNRFVVGTDRGLIYCFGMPDGVDGPTANSPR